MTERALAEQAERLVWLLPRVFRLIFRHDPGDPATELPAAQLRVCAVLSEGPLAITALARELGTSASAATQLADRLEASGLVARGAEPADRRVKHLALTPHGDDVMRRRRERRVQRAAEVLAQLSPEARAEVLAALARLADAGLAVAAVDGGGNELPTAY